MAISPVFRERDEGFLHCGVFESFPCGKIFHHGDRRVTGADRFPSPGLCRSHPKRIGFRSRSTTGLLLSGVVSTRVSLGFRARSFDEGGGDRLLQGASLLGLRLVLR